MALNVEHKLHERRRSANRGVGLLLLGFIGIVFALTVVKVGQLDDVRQFEGPNYVSTLAEMGVWRGDQNVTVLTPEKRFYPVAKMPTTEAAIRNGILRDIYVVIGDAQAGGGYAVRVYDDGSRLHQEGIDAAIRGTAEYQTCHGACGSSLYFCRWYHQRDDGCQSG